MHQYLGQEEIPLERCTMQIENLSIVPVHTLILLTDFQRPALGNDHEESILKTIFYQTIINMFKCKTSPTEVLLKQTI